MISVFCNSNPQNEEETCLIQNPYWCIANNMQVFSLDLGGDWIYHISPFRNLQTKDVVFIENPASGNFELMKWKPWIIETIWNAAPATIQCRLHIIYHHWGYGCNNYYKPLGPWTQTYDLTVTLTKYYNYGIWYYKSASNIYAGTDWPVVNQPVKTLWIRFDISYGWYAYLIYEATECFRSFISNYGLTGGHALASDYNVVGMYSNRTPGWGYNPAYLELFEVEVLPS
jgi:hypothetical protein